MRIASDSTPRISPAGRSASTCRSSGRRSACSSRGGARIDMSGSRGVGRPELSVIIVAYNCRQYLGPCLEALERETASLPLEVIVVDNASTDGSPEVVADEYPW